MANGTLHRIAWVALLSLVCGAAHAQTLSNISVAKNAGNSADYLNITPSWTHGQRASAVQLTSAGATSFATHYYAILSADSELFGTGAYLRLDSDYTIAFTVNAPGSYRVTVQTRRKGELTLHEDNVFVADHFADMTALAGSQAGGTLVSGNLDLADPGRAADIPFVFDPIFVAFDQTKTAMIQGVSNGANVAHTLTFTWWQEVWSPAAGDEAAVRLGGTSLDPDETAARYPGSPGRVQADDGHFVTVTVEPLCGDGASGPGEGCDEGPANGTPGSCCTASCQPKSAGTTCRFGAGPCDVAEQCDGSSGSCPANGFASSSTVCRAASAGQVCDEDEVCTGSSADCPGDGAKPPGTVCRFPADLCDVAEACDGASKLCPGDGKAPAGTVCRAGGDECNPAEHCDGVSIACPADAIDPNGTACADDEAFCTGAETCQGGTCTSAGDPCTMGFCDEAGDQCVSAGCAFGPLAGCRTGENSILFYKDRDNDGGDKLLVKWTGAQSASQADLGDPTRTADYELCLYAGPATALLLEAAVPADPVKWDALGTRGYKYRDAEADADGAQKILLKGSDSANTRILWKGRGLDLPDLAGGTLPLGSGDFPLLVQLMNVDNGVCFEASFEAGDALKNADDQLKLKDQ